MIILYHIYRLIIIQFLDYFIIIKHACLLLKYWLRDSHEGARRVDVHLGVVVVVKMMMMLVVMMVKLMIMMVVVTIKIMLIKMRMMMVTPRTRQILVRISCSVRMLTWLMFPTQSFP